MYNSNLRFIYLLLCITFLSGCASVSKQLSDIVFNPHTKSEQSQKESTSVEIFYRTEFENNQIQSPVTAFIIGGAFKQISKLLEEEAKKYSATYSAGSVSNKFFVDNINDEINPVGLIFKRKVEIKKKEEIAMCFAAVIFPLSDQSFFEIKPISYSLNYSKAKIIGFDWLSPFGIDILNPWEIVTKPISGEVKGIPMDDDLDLAVTIDLRSAWLDRNNIGQNKILGTQSFQYRNVKIGADEVLMDEEAIKSGLYACNTITGQTIYDLWTKRANYTTKSIQSLFPRVPRTYENTTAKGDGVFSLNVSVLEIDDYGKRIKEIGNYFEENKTGWTQQLNDTFTGSN